MTELAAASVVARVSALIWALVLLQRTQDVRMLRLFVAIAVLTAWLVTTLALDAPWFSSFALVSDLGSLTLSACLLLSVPMLESYLGRERKRRARDQEESERLAELESRRETVLRARARQQEAVANLGRRVLASSNLEAAVEDAVHTAARALEVAGCGYFEYVPASRSLVLSAGGGALAPFTRTVITAAPEHQLGISVTEGSRLVVDDFDARGAPRRPPLLPYVASRSGVSVVALGSESTFGVLAAFARESDRFTEEDAHFLQGIANLLVSAIERDRTLRELDRGREKVYQAQKLEALGTLSGGIAHDFNNMLQAIVGHTQLALGEMREGSAAQSNLRQVLSAAQRARELTSQVLTFGQRSRPQRVRIEIRPIIEEVVGLMRATVPPHLQIQTRIDAPGASVHADSIQLYQVLVNLCTNAAHALRGRTGGVLEIGVDVDPTTRSQSGQSFVRIWVHDDGPGIRPEVRERIFEPFFTARVDGCGPGEGTGMGLAVVHGIVQAHGGSIRVESEPGRGATFFVLLPSAEPLPLRPAVVPAARPSGATLLFVDDEPALVSMAKQGLSAEGYEVVGMTSSKQALEEFRRNPDRYRLVLMDQNMPGLKGEALAKELLAIRKDLPIILCTGYAEEWTPEQARALGVREYLTKPISLDALAAIVRRTLERA
jgi:signal transduction histidine kinase/ActR/RegA family two-component response regulator